MEIIAKITENKPNALSRFYKLTKYQDKYMWEVCSGVHSFSLNLIKDTEHFRVWGCLCEFDEKDLVQN